MDNLLAILFIVFLYAALLSPLLCTLYLATVKGGGIRYRWLFPLITVASVYAITIFIYIGAVIFISPLYSDVLDIGPTYIESGRELPYWMPIIGWIVTNQYLIVAVFLVVMSAWIAKYLWPQWRRRFKESA